MKILIELSLIINILVNFFILKCTSASLKIKCKFAFLSSMLGAIIALIVPMFNISVVVNLIIQVLLSSAMCLICFEIKPFKKFLVTYAIFFGYTFMFGGACYAVSNVFGQIPLVAVLCVAGVGYIISQLVIKYQNKIRRLRQFSFKVVLHVGEKIIEEEGFLDSGNVLYDPITNKPIILITYDVFSQLYSDINYVTAYCKQVDTKKIGNAHYVKINTVASGTSILVFTAKQLEIFEGEQKRNFENVSVGLSFSGFDKALGKKILLHREFA